MTGEPITTIVGNLTADPELRFTPQGQAVANFTVASTPRTFDRQANEWKEGEALFMRCSVWRDYAEHVAESLTRGMRVVVTGALVSRSWVDKESGQKRSVTELRVDEVGPSLRYATAKVVKAERPEQGGGWGQQQPQGQPWGGNGGQPDPWSTSGGNAQQGAPQGQQGAWGAPPPAQGQQQGAWGGNTPTYDEAPF